MRVSKLTMFERCNINTGARMKTASCKSAAVSTMKVLIFLSLLVASALADTYVKRYPLDNWIADEGVAAYNRHVRIVNGQIVVPNSVPFQVAVLTTMSGGGTGLCGGSLLTRNRVVTAAHCWTDGRNQGVSIQVVLGAHRFNQNENGQQRQNTNTVNVHPQYTPATAAHDVAIVRLNSLVTLTNNIQTIRLPTGTLANQNFAGVTATISGWGRMGDNLGTSADLRQVQVPVLTLAQCRNFFSAALVRENNLCTNGAGPRGACQGDSGGPVTVVNSGSRVLVGIVSFGSAQGCNSGFPSVHARVTSFLTFINQNL